MMDGMRVAPDSLPALPLAVDASDALDTLRPRAPRASPDHATHLIQRRVHRPTGKRISIPVMDIETWDEFGMLIGDRCTSTRLRS